MEDDQTKRGPPSFDLPVETERIERRIERKDDAPTHASRHAGRQSDDENEEEALEGRMQTGLRDNPINLVQILALTPGSSRSGKGIHAPNRW
mmetsp:Transcript_19742/g.39731  ORF Transcript_19742/g.39731 Transcript_19742/m.39731 type:complete len:92 (+) Transcript_19742:369-644(+)